MVAPPFGMANDHVSAAYIPKHGGGYVTGMRALFVPMAILRRHGNVAALQSVRHRPQRGERRRHHHVTMFNLGKSSAELFHKLHRFADGLVHFPVASYHWSSNHNHPLRKVSSRQSAEGSRQ